MAFLKHLCNSYDSRGAVAEQQFILQLNVLLAQIKGPISNKLMRESDGVRQLASMPEVV